MPQKLLLLHGALGSREQFKPLLPLLSDRASVFSINLEGHGPSPTVNRPFRIQYFAENILHWMDRYQHRQIDIFGYSMGGYVALYLALHHPERVGKIFTLGTKYFWNRENAQAEIQNLQPDTLLAKVPAFADILKWRHSPNDWKEVVTKTAELIQYLSAHPEVNTLELARIQNRIRIGVGDIDRMVSIEESDRLRHKLPNAELMVLPNTPHPIDKVAIPKLSFYIKEFFEH
jgi:pimeloyl-ACP methyl ester carboxylesterase